MFNLYQIVSGAQGGQALDHLAQQFGISREQADSAVKALMPALSTAFMTKAAQPGGLGDLAGHMNDSQHSQAYSDANAAQAPATQQKGGDVADAIFGNNAIIEQVVAQASRYTGIPAATLQQMLPVIVSLVVGGVATIMRNQGMGGLLGQLAHGGLGGILGQFGGAATQPGGMGGAGMGNTMGGIISSVLNSFLGGGQNAGSNPGATQPGAPQPSTAQPTPGVPPAMQAGLDALTKMFHPGVQASAAQPDNLGDQIGAILGDKTR